MKLIKEILSEMNNVCKPQKKFFAILMYTIISMYGKINFSSLSRYSGLAEKTFRRWFQMIFDFVDFNARAIRKVIKTSDDVIAAYDQSFDGKAGKHTWGKDYFWNGCTSRAEKGLELVLCALVNVTKNTAYALGAEQTPATEKSEHAKSVKKKIDDFSRIDFYLSFIKKHVAVILCYTKYFAFDGYFTKKKFVDGIVEMGFQFIGKLRCDANLKFLYTGEQKKGPGRPKKFAGKCNIDKLEGFNFECNIDETTKLYFGIFYHVSLEREIKVVAVQYQKRNSIGTALLFSTDLSLEAVKIFTYYKARFQIEFVFRDAKQYTGLSDCQSRKKETLSFHYNASFTALNLVKIQEQLETHQHQQPKTFSMASHKVRYHNENLIDRFFSKLAPGVTLIKSSPIFQEVLNYGAVIFR